MNPVALLWMISDSLSFAVTVNCNSLGRGQNKTIEHNIVSFWETLNRWLQLYCTTFNLLIIFTTNLAGVWSVNQETNSSQ